MAKAPMRMKMPPVKAQFRPLPVRDVVHAGQGRVDIGFIGAIDAKNGAFFMQIIIIKWVVLVRVMACLWREWYRVI